MKRSKIAFNRRWSFLLVGVLALILASLAGMFVITEEVEEVNVAHAQTGSVLIYGPSVTSLEQQVAQGLGFVVTVADAATWSGMNAAQFAAFDAIVFGDNGCTNKALLATAEANRAVWSPAAVGPIVVLGTDPVSHSPDPRGLVDGTPLIENGISFAASGAGTGLYVSLNCYYRVASPGTPVLLLDQIGTFTVQGCTVRGTIVDPAHPVVARLTDSDFSGAGMSAHECFNSFPASFSVLVQEVGGTLPFIVARIAEPDSCVPGPKAKCKKKKKGG